MNTNRPVDPLSNLFILHLLGSEENKDLLYSFVNAVFTQYGHPKVHNLSLLNPFNLAEYKAGKMSIVDIKAETEEGDYIIIEIQVNRQPSFADRSLYYWAYNYQKQLKTAESYTSLSPVICINLINFTLFPEIEDYRTCFQITEKNRPEYVLTEHLQIFFIELEKLTIELTDNTRFANLLEQWCCYFKTEGLLKEEEMPVLLHNNQALKKAHKVYEHFVSDPEKMAILEAQEKWERDFKNRMEGSWRDGLAEGMEKGLKKGVRRGMEQGIEQGIEQGVKDTALKMLAEGMDIEAVARITGLSKEIVASLNIES